MEIRELNADERIALAGLVKAVLLSDSRISEEERDEVAEIVEAVGQPAYQQALDTFEARFPDEESFKRFLAGAGRPDARDLIYGTILQGASADAIEGRESEILAWLEKTWGIEVKVEDEPADGGDGAP